MSKNKLLNKILLIAFALSLNLLASGCATAPNTPVCVEINPAKGFCTWTIEDKDQIVDDSNLLDGKTWWDMRPTMIQVPPESWSKIKAFIIKTCKQSNKCDEQITSWDRKLDSIDEKLKQKGSE